MKENKQQLPKIVSISLSAWRENSGIHTQTELFKFWDKERLAQIYTKSDYPDTSVCDRFFRISENQVIKSVYKRKPVGERVENRAKETDEDAKAIEEEHKLYEKAHKKKSWFMKMMRELVWALGKWKTKELDTFIEEEQPDVYFVPIYPVVYMGKLQLHILKKYPRPYVCYLADDNYSYQTCGKNPFAYIHRFLLRKVVKKLAKNCNQMFTITQTEAEDTDKLFGTHSVVLTKGIDYTNLIYQEKPINNPLRMVYTGKLIIGRGETLAKVADAVRRINADGQRIVLDVYAPDTPNEKLLSRLNGGGCRFMGCVNKDEVQKIQDEADVVVFVESLEKKYRMDARLSFSTKLTDYFRSGKCIFAVGDKRIAPIEYLQDNDCAIIANEYEEIEKKLRQLLADEKIVHEYGKKAFDCGKRNHDAKKVKQVFIETFMQSVK
ncbi:MAG: hypothetical protein IJ996_06115 [Clostridia bacterium]|nr:hypothetical protein [Clostridia bacterium]